MSRGTQATINLKHLKHNYKVLQTLAPNKLVLVVKADAYGHGLKQIIQTLDEADCFAVATIEEAMTIRRINPTVRIVLLEGFLSLSELHIAIDNKFDSVIHQQQQLDMLDTLTLSNRINIWLKYDSGMNRLGFNAKDFTTAIGKLENKQQVNELILMSHLASANLTQSDFTKQQTKKFLEISNNHTLSLSNSSALLTGKNLVDEWCRVGLSLFGVSPIEGKKSVDFNLKPVMTLKTNVIAIKKVSAGETIGYSQTYTAKFDSQIAIIGIGYGDGYPWAINPSAYVKIDNTDAPIVGSVSMDMIAIDITEVKNITVGDSVLIWGEEDTMHLPIETIAENANTIPYVLLCQLTSRVHYKYV